MSPMRALFLCILPFASACRSQATADAPGAAVPALSASSASLAPAKRAQVLRGRHLVIARDCGACHGGLTNPAAEGWLAGRASDEDIFPVEGFKVRARNLTPDEDTGLGRISERRIFNALRYGLRPAGSPDAEVTSHVPGQGNHPARPNYLSSAMPWLVWRFMPDEDLWAIAAYLKHGVRPVRNAVPPSEMPADLWASRFPSEKYGSHEMPPFPTAHEQEPPAERKEQVLRGRALVAATACAACHGGGNKPSDEGWLVGMRDSTQAFSIGPFTTRPRNLTPHNTTGMGRFSERQVFNALRFGLRPGETPELEITSTIPGQGNHPANPKYLAPPMPWPAWRHMSDDELWAIAAYLKHGVKPVRNRVADSDGPPDFWRSVYTPESYGTYPPAPFPTSGETGFTP